MLKDFTNQFFTNIPVTFATAALGIISNFGNFCECARVFGLTQKNCYFPFLRGLQSKIRRVVAKLDMVRLGEVERSGEKGEERKGEKEKTHCQRLRAE